jgi:hypothetical protein
LSQSRHRPNQHRFRAPRNSTRTSILIVAGGVALLGLTVVLALRNSAAPRTTPQAAGAPRLKVDRERVDLGSVRLGQTVAVSFELTNVGDQPLRFTEAPFVEVVEGC